MMHIKWHKKRKEQPSGGTTATSATSSVNPTEGVALTQKLMPQEKEERLKDTTCFCCEEMGHFAPQCPKGGETDRKDWKIKSDRKRGTSWLQVHGGQEEMCLHQTPVTKQSRKTDFDNDSVLDTGATFSSMKNKDLLAGVHPATRSMKMLTNTGHRHMTERGELLGLQNDPWLDEKSMANIISFAELKGQCRVTCDSNDSDSFCVHGNDGVVEFSGSEEGPHATALSSTHKKRVAERDGSLPGRQG